MVYGFTVYRFTGRYGISAVAQWGPFRRRFLKLEFDAYSESLFPVGGRS